MACCELLYEEDRIRGWGWMLNPCSEEMEERQLAIVKQMSRQESRSSAGNCHADEPAGITQLSRP